MVITNISEDLKAILERISGMCLKAESVLSFCIDGFMKHKVKFIDEAKKVSQVIHNEENELMRLLSDKATKPDADKELIKSLMVVIGHIELATNGLDSVLQHVRVKASESILFTDKAVNEISHLFKETLDLLKTAGDTIMTRNDVLRKYIVSKYMSLNEMVDGYSVEHEERLIKGLCQPASSSLYLDIVDSLMKVVWHIKQAVDRIFANR